MLNLILATWRLTSLLHSEDGPAQIFEKFRHWLGVRYDERSNRYATTNLAEGVLCFWCCSVWGSALICLLAAVLKIVRWRDIPLHILAMSTGAILIDSLMEE